MESDLIQVIKTIKTNGGFNNYIDFVRFPFYRNLEVDTVINLQFPLTIFIGQNGCGKSSCLHAIYGAPKGNTPSSFWFDTSVDPIAYYDDSKKRHSFWYSFVHSDGTIKEVIKARIRRNNDPNYWETSRPLAWAGMQSRVGNDRDQPIEKKVVYIDFRGELSAFDKYFYFGNTKGVSAKTKQEFIRKKSRQLKNVISGTKEFYYTSAGKVNKALRVITTDELKWISFILGKTYISAKFLEHSFFRNEGYTVIFKTSNAEYSEAFAGSGEVAVVRLVLKILEAEFQSLILLDEPEVSLHPGAQSRLKFFLLDQIKVKKHQIILTSHSPSIVSGLPKEAIKVFYQNPNNGRFLVKENLTPEEAFYHIEFPLNEKKNVIVEDILAQEILTAVLSRMGNESQNLFNIKFNPGGETVIKKEFITVFCRDTASKNYVYFDGDQKPQNSNPDWRTFATSDINPRFLKRIIREQTGEEIKFSVDGAGGIGNENQQLDLLKKYLDYNFLNVFYLPRQIPEEIIWDENVANNLASIILSNEKYQDYTLQISSEINYKKKFSILANFISSDKSSATILGIQKQFIQAWINNENEDYTEIKQNLQNLILR